MVCKDVDCMMIDALHGENMDYDAFEILGLPSTATRDEVKDKYNELRKQYLEDRFKPGDEGERAAEKLQELDVAYRDAMDAIDEREQANYRASNNFDNGTTDNTSVDDFDKVRDLIKDNKLDEAQTALDQFINRNAEWHYLQSILFYKRNWFLESKKQLEMACQMEPQNQRYKQSLDKLTKILASNTISPDQMRTSSQSTDDARFYDNGTCTGNACADCLLCNACCNCASCMAGPGC